MEAIQKALAGEIDYVGQLKADRLQRYLIIATTALAFLVGYALQQIHVTAIIFAAGCLLTALTTAPPWPCYNRNPIRWNDASKNK